MKNRKRRNERKLRAAVRAAKETVDCGLRVFVAGRDGVFVRQKEAR